MKTMSTSKTFHYVKPLPAAAEAAWKARADVFFDECRAAHDAASAASIARILDREAQEARDAQPPMRIAA
jgi:hypothetical protein